MKTALEQFLSFGEAVERSRANDIATMRQLVTDRATAPDYTADYCAYCDADFEVQAEEAYGVDLEEYGPCNAAVFTCPGCGTEQVEVVEYLDEDDLADDLSDYYCDMARGN